MDSRTMAKSTVIVEDADTSRIWPPKLNGTETAPAINRDHDGGEQPDAEYPPEVVAHQFERARDRGKDPKPLQHDERRRKGQHRDQIDQ